MNEVQADGGIDDIIARNNTKMEQESLTDEAVKYDAVEIEEIIDVET